jgi:hypothetical protein
METKKVNRRDFFRLSATVGAGALLLPNVTASAVGMMSGSGNNEYPTLRLRGLLVSSGTLVSCRSPMIKMFVFLKTEAKTIGKMIPT